MNGRKNRCDVAVAAPKSRTLGLVKRESTFQPCCYPTTTFDSNSLPQKFVSSGGGNEPFGIFWAVVLVAAPICGLLPLHNDDDDENNKTRSSMPCFVVPDPEKALIQPNVVVIVPEPERDDVSIMKKEEESPHNGWRVVVSQHYDPEPQKKK